MEVHFLHLESLHWLWAVFAVVLLSTWAILRRRRALRLFADAHLLPALVRTAGTSRHVARSILIVLTLILLIAAMIDPRWGLRYEEVQRRGVDVVIMLDVSRSMLAEDVRPNRLERAKQAIRDLLEELHGDRAALVTFAGNASITCPLTVDYSAYRMVLDTVDEHSAGRGGSQLADALAVARTAFTDDAPDHKAIIIFTDGEGHDDPEQDAAAIAFGAPVYTVGLGDANEGARIPVETNGQRDYLLDDQGRQVWSKMNPDRLRDLALSTNGAFVPAGTGAVDMGTIYRERIEPMTKRAFETTIERRRIPRFQWFAGAALVLLLIDTLLGDGGDRREIRRMWEVAR